MWVFYVLILGLVEPSGGTAVRMEYSYESQAKCEAGHKALTDGVRVTVYRQGGEAGSPKPVGQPPGYVIGRCTKK